MRYKTITSLSNPLIKETLKGKKTLLRKAMLIEGNHFLGTALESGVDIRRVFFTGKYRSENEAFLIKFSGKKTELIEVTEHILSRLADTETPQGVVAEVGYKGRKLQEVSLQRDPLIVVCDGIQDPGNLGTIIRTADAAGADAVALLPGTCDPFMPKGVRATAGSIFNLPVVFLEPDALVEWLRKKSISLMASDVHASRSIYDTDMRKPLAFVFGNEAAGVSEYLKGKSDMKVRIPIPGKAESLNVATSAAICLYEAVRQRRGRHQ
jgi:TrmH family RNA methyltransferase